MREFTMLVSVLQLTVPIEVATRLDNKREPLTVGISR